MLEMQLQGLFGFPHLNEQLVLRFVLDVANGQGTDADGSAGGTGQRRSVVLHTNPFDAGGRQGV